ncbi:hypothetical protein HCN44_009525 [Aphidius gifuensis]|uniref:GDP-D-glucose phosphorylase 1 n=1 Tax=Aphidius gifuensis TaxID=684658 RepID=A0A834Y5A1_APHGI|nr:GDP-D-glucose phosphorylase 1 [Aphidius gifuensis]KAF7998127.1 hypothetical protein HCN44_009525 [Aphidius gifuensis]
MELSTFHYNCDDFTFQLNNNNTINSKFDDLIENKWKQAEKNSVFKYKLNIIKSKYLQGNYGFIAQLNLDRAKNRRTPEDITSMKKSFDKNRFNFTKIKNEEIFFDVGDGTGSDVIIANVSPLEYGHCLFIPDRFKELPQVVTKTSIIKVVELFLCSQSTYLRLIFNSLCAHASVNHHHWHFYYLKYRMLLENIETDKFAGPLEVLKNYPAKGFCLKLSSFNNDPEKFALIGFKIINYLQDNEISHNIYITRAFKSSTSDKIIFDDVRMYIWARKSSFGIKDTTGFIPAVCELFGHLTIRTEEGYDNLTENTVAEILDDVTTEIYNKVKDDVKKLIDDC